MTDLYEFSEGYEFDSFTLVNLKDDQILSLVGKISINVPNLEGWTLLMYACNNGQKSLVQHLISVGAQISHSGPKTPLMLAVGSGDLDIVRLVFNIDDLEKRDGRGWTAIFYAVFYGRELCAEFLLRKGANSNITDSFGQTPVHIAVKYGMESMVTLLLGTNKMEMKTPSRTPSRLTPKAKTSIFRQVRTYSPNVRRIEKENEPTSTPAKKLNFVGIPSSPKNARTVNVSLFLVDLGLEKYWPIFRDEEIDFETLMTFNEENLSDIGIKLYGPRKKLMKAIQEYRTLHGGDLRLLKNSTWLK